MADPSRTSSRIALGLEEGGVILDVMIRPDRWSRQMATNAPGVNGRRQGAVKNRSQMSKPEGAKWTKRDKMTGECIDQKRDDKSFKGVRREY